MRTQLVVGGRYTSWSGDHLCIGAEDSYPELLEPTLASQGIHISADMLARLQDLWFGTLLGWDGQSRTSVVSSHLDRRCRCSSRSCTFPASTYMVVYAESGYASRNWCGVSAIGACAAWVSAIVADTEPCVDIARAGRTQQPGTPNVLPRRLTWPTGRRTVAGLHAMLTRRGIYSSAQGREFGCVRKGQAATATGML